MVKTDLGDDTDKLLLCCEDFWTLVLYDLDKSLAKIKRVLYSIGNFMVKKKTKKKLTTKNKKTQTDDLLIVVRCVETKQDAVVSLKKIETGFNPFKKNGFPKKGYEVKK